MFPCERGEYGTKGTEIFSRQSPIMSIRICETFAIAIGAE
jgi:hypothetical protein